MTNNKFYIINVSESAYPQPEKNFEYKNVSYDQSNYCHKCRLGLVQNNPIRLSSDIENKTYELLGLHWIFDVIFARQSAINVFTDNKIIGIHSLKPIFNKSKLPIDNLNQILIDSKIKINLIDEENTSKKCPSCGQIKFYYPTKHNISIKKGTLDNLNVDFIQSTEYIGESPHHLNLVSEKVTNIITSLKWKGIKLQPINEL